MRVMTTRVMSSVLILALGFGGCATGPGQLAMQTIGKGIVGLVLSPLMIASGVAQGLAFLPYTVGTGLAQLNRALLDAQAVPLDDAYKSTFGVAIADPRVDQQTGEIAGETLRFGRNRPEAVLEATRAFQRLLVSQGMPEASAQHYVLGGDYTHVATRGIILLSVAYRHPGLAPFRATSKHTGIVTTFRPDDRGWREPYATDVKGRPVDEVIDWVALDYPLLRQDKVVATLMVIAAESVKVGRRTPDYWQIERRWLAGEIAPVLTESRGRVRVEGLDPGVDARASR